MSELNVNELKAAISKYDNGDYLNSLSVFYKFAREGYIVAGYYIGVCTINGWGTNKNEASGAELIMRVAQEGYPPAQAYVGKILEKGIPSAGIPKNRELAIEWYKAAARQDNKEALVRLRELGYSMS